MRPIARYAAPLGPPIELPGPPPKTTFGGSGSPEGLRIGRYMREVESDVAPLMADPAPLLGIRLDVGLATSVDPLTHNDLDNYLEPLASHLGRGRLVGAWAKKGRGNHSTLVLGSVGATPAALDGCAHATASSTGLTTTGKRDIGRQVANQCRPTRWGPISMELAIRVSSADRWVRAWKPIIDSLVAILGRRPGKTEFDIEDGRIVELALHCEVERSLKHRVEVELWWRAAECSESDAEPPAPLSYEVGTAASDLSRERPRSRVPGGRRIPRLQAPESSKSGITLIRDLNQFTATQTAGVGFVVITDRANPIRIHRAGCPSVRKANFARKVIQNGMRTGEYFAVADLDAAQKHWPDLRAHACVNPEEAEPG